VVNAEVVTLGVAIAVPDPWGIDLQEARAGYGDRLAWTIPTHITLLPPTQVPRTRLPQVDEHLAAIATGTPAFEVTLGGADTFRPVTPTVFLRVEEGAKSCESMADAIRSGPLRRRQQFPYHPHVTLAFDVADEVLDRAFADHATYSLTFKATHITRYDLGEDGIWQPEADFTLGEM